MKLTLSSKYQIMRQMFKIIIALSVLTMFFGVSKSVAQCTCKPALNLANSLKRADVVFIGKVIDAKNESSKAGESNVIFVKFEVTQTWKQNLEKEFNIVMFHDEASDFVKNEEWLVFAEANQEGTYQADISCCSRTKRLLNYDYNLKKVFKKLGEKPKKILKSKTK